MSYLLVVLGLKGVSTPIPQEPTAVSCTLNNGIHFVTTPECKFSRDCAINQEFELYVALPFVVNLILIFIVASSTVNWSSR